MEADRSAHGAEIERLRERLAELEGRVVALERAAPRAAGLSPDQPTPARRDAAEVPPPADESGESRPAETIPLIGRTLVVLGGGFALRAFTEAEIVPQLAGMALGLAYAILWVVLADRAAGRERRTGATFHGLAAAFIGFPLIWESTVKFELLSATAGAVAIAGFTALALGVAARRNLRRLAWIVTLGALATILVLAVATKILALFFALLLVLGVATLHLGYLREWRALGWLVALVVDAALLLMTAIVLFGDTARGAAIAPPGPLVALQLSLVGAYVISLIYRTLSTGGDVTSGEIAQAVAALIIGLGGAIAVTGSAAVSVLPLGAVSFLLGAGCYGIAFAFMDRRLERRINFVFYTTLALLFVMAAFDALLDELPLVLGFVAVAIFTGWLGGRRARATLSLHGAVYAVAAAVTSGLIAAAIDCFTGSTVPPPGWISASTLTALAAAAACCWFPVAAHGRTWGTLSLLPKLLVLAVLLLGVGGLAVTLGTRLRPADDAAALAALRTALVALSALTVAALSRWDRVSESVWLVYPVLLIGGVKLMVEDFRVGTPATLFLSLALYGGALIIAPRIGRARK